MGKMIDLTGEKFGFLRVVGFDHFDKRRLAHWKCECECGSCCVVDGHSLRRGHTKSCGKGQHFFNEFAFESDYVICAMANTGNECMIDKDDYERIKDFYWYEDNGYARATVNGKKVKMHRFILNPSGGMFVDHINHNTLDNRKKNLRIVTPAQNSMNTKPRSDHGGVSWCKLTNKWHAQISVGGKNISLGRYADIGSAIAARKNAEEKYYGQYRYVK